MAKTRVKTRKKPRWSEKKKEREKAFLYGQMPLSERPQRHKRKQKGVVSKVAKAEPKALVSTGGGRAKKKIKRAKAKKFKQVDEVGDTIVEHDFNDSEDEEEEEIRRDLAKKRREEAAEAARGQLQVFVSGIPWTADKEKVRKHFHKKCGAVAEFAYPLDDRGRPKGFAFITFATEAAVTKALASDGQEYKSRKLSVKVATKKKGGGGAEDDDSEGSSLNSDDDSS